MCRAFYRHLSLGNIQPLLRRFRGIDVGKKPSRESPGKKQRIAAGNHPCSMISLTEVLVQELQRSVQRELCALRGEVVAFVAVKSVPGIGVDI